jgi:RHS repeat-associated protein
MSRINWARRLVAVLIAVIVFHVGAVIQPVPAQASARPPSEQLNTTQNAPGTPVVAYGATGWKALPVAFNGNAGFEASGFDDSSWPTGQAAFGSGGGCPLQSTVHASWPTNTDLLVRRHLSQAELAPGQGVQIWFAIDNDIMDVYWNGTRIGGGITHENCATIDSFGISVPPTSITTDNVLAVRARDRGVESFLDLAVIKGGLSSEGAPSSVLLHQNSGASPDPVQTFHGAFLYNHRDLSIPGRGPVISFVRSYNSADTRVGPMGPGWTHTYNARIRDTGDGSGDLFLVRPNGNTDRFKRNNDESFSPSLAVYSTLIRNADESYTVTEKDQSRWDFDGAGRLTKITDRYGNASTLTYNASNQLATVTDPAGRGSLTLAYTNGLLTTLTDWASPARTVVYQYDTSGRLWKVTDRESQTTTFTYDGTSARIATITDARNHVALTLTYDAQGRVATQKDAKGLVTGDLTTFAYIVNGDGTRVTTFTEPVTSFEPSFHPTVDDTYDANGWLTKRVSKPSSTETLTEMYTYDSIGNRASVTDPRNSRTDYCYDVTYTGGAIPGSRGNLTRVVGPPPAAGANRPVALVAYDAKNNVTQTVAPKGVPSSPTESCATNVAAITTAYATDLAYDASGIKLLSVTSRFTDPDTGLKTATTKYEYGDAANSGRPTKVIPARGNTTGSPDYTYATSLAYFGPGSKAGLLSSAADALGDLTTFDYDLVGRLVSVIDPNGNAVGGVPADHTTNYVYDKEDRTRFVKLPAPAAGGTQLVSETRYDEVGNPVVRIDANGQVATSSYDERDGLFQLKESPNSWTDPASPPAGVITTEYAYDAVGNLTRMTRAKGDAPNERVTDYAYDGRRLARRETQYPAWPTTTPTIVTTSTYDPVGNALTLVDPLGQTTTNAYDALNRLTSIDYSSAATPDVAYGYDANGNRTSMTDGAGSTSYAYDEANRLTSATTPGPKTVGYRYDLDGNRTKLIYPDATAVTYTFNKVSQLTSLLDWASRSTSYSYFADGAVKDVTNVNATTATYAYDNARRLTSIVHKLGTSVIDQRNYTLDPLGNVLAVGGGATGDVTELISQSTGKVHGNGASNQSYLSADGRYVVFQSSAANLVTGDTNAVDDVFLRDRLDGTTIRVSVSSSGIQGNGASSDPAISADGRYVVYTSAATNLVSGDTNAKVDIFVFDRTTAATTRASLANAGAQSNHSSGDAVVSGDGRYVAFRSGASNLVTGDTNGVDDIFLRDRTANTTIRVSVATGGAQATGASAQPAISDDGRYTVYHSDAANLVSGDTNALRDIFLYDKTSAATTRLSVASGGTQGNALSEDPAISGDGTIAAFESDATNLVSGDANVKKDVFVRVLATGAMERASVSSSGAEGNHTSREAALSRDGRYVAFDSVASNLTTGDTNGDLDIFVRDRTAGTTTLRSFASGGSTPGNDQSLNPAISSDGKTVAFESDATNLIIDDTNAARDVFVRGSGVDASTYGYDRLSRLTSVGGPDGSRTYGYDPSGNRSSRVLAGATTTYSYDRADRISAAGATAITVNANGNTTARGGDTFTFDQANRLKTATVAGATETYIYDGAGVRFSRQVGAASPVRYVSDVNRTLPVTIDDGGRKYVYGLGLAYAVAGASLEVFHVDGLGTIRAITDATGTVTSTYRTDEWGVTTAATGSSTQPFRFAGEAQDATGLTFLRSRYYDPSLGRFLSRDTWAGTVVRPDTLNRYAYAGDNPASRRDPSGRCWFLVGEGAVIGATGGTVLTPGPGTAVGAAGGATAGFVVCLGLIAGGVLLGKAIVDQRDGQSIPVPQGPPITIRPQPAPPQQRPPGEDPLGPGPGRGPDWLFKLIAGSVIVSIIGPVVMLGINAYGDPAEGDLPEPKPDPSKPAVLKPYPDPTPS